MPTKQCQGNFLTTKQCQSIFLTTRQCEGNFFDIFARSTNSKNKKPIIATSSYSQNTIKESYNEIDFKTGLGHISNIYFRDEYFIENGVNDVKNNLKQDPLFLILRHLFSTPLRL